MIFQTEKRLRLLGWSGADRWLIALAENSAGTSAQPTTVTMLELTRSTQHELGTWTETYLNNIHLSPNGRQLAFVKAPNGRNDVWITTVNGGQFSSSKKLTTNNDPTFVLSNLAWSPDSKMIYFDRQTRWSLLTMVEGIK